MSRATFRHKAFENTESSPKVEKQERVGRGLSRKHLLIPALIAVLAVSLALATTDFGSKIVSGEFGITQDNSVTVFDFYFVNGTLYIDFTGLASTSYDVTIVVDGGTPSMKTVVTNGSGVGSTSFAIGASTSWTSVSGSIAH